MGNQCKKYVQKALRNVESILKKYDLFLLYGISSPLPGSYYHECDITPVCDTSNAQLNASLIGILRWLVELGRRYITCEVSMMSTYTAMPREGHLNNVLYIFLYLKKHCSSRLVSDPTCPYTDMSLFEHHNWKQFYGDVKELLPVSSPRAIGKGIQYTDLYGCRISCQC